MNFGKISGDNSNCIFLLFHEYTFVQCNGSSLSVFMCVSIGEGLIKSSADDVKTDNMFSIHGIVNKREIIDEGASIKCSSTACILLTDIGISRAAVSREINIRLQLPPPPVVALEQSVKNFILWT